MNIIVLGPKDGSGGISAVIDSIISSPVLKQEFLTKIDTCVYKDGGKLKELSTFFQGMLKYTLLVINKATDIIHIHSSFKYSFFRKSIFAIMAFLCKKKVIFHIHSSAFYSFFIYQKNRFVKKYIGFILQKTDLNIVLCNDWKKKLEITYGLNNVIKIRNPNPNLNSVVYKPNGIVSDRVNFLFVGFYIPSKGIMDLLEAASLVKGQNLRNFCLTLCGKGEMEKQIHSKVREYELEENVVNIGWVSGEEKDNCFRKADVFVLPSYKEGMPMVILEAFSYGLPVISTSISGIPELIEHEFNGFLIKPGDIDSLVKYMKLMIDDHRVRRLMRERNIKHIDYFNRDLVAEQWKNVYTTLYGKC